MGKFISFISITRLDKPIGIYLLLYPSLIAFLFATNNLLDSADLYSLEVQESLLSSLIIIILGCILVRSAGCVINDIFDYKFDKRVNRTKGRPIANGSLSLSAAWIIFITLGILSILLLIQTNPQTIIIGCITALLIIIYPLTKRFILGPQFFLAITFGGCIPIVFSMLGQIHNSEVILLYIANAAWIIAYDTFYAMGDAEDDIKIGINSTPLWWKDNTIFLIKIFQLIFISTLLILGLLESFSFLWFIGIISLLLFFYYQHVLAKQEKFLEAFKNNNYVGLSLLLILLIELNIDKLIS